MTPQKINLLSAGVCPTLDAPTFKEHNINICGHEELLPDININIVDYRHWVLSDDEFRTYINKILNLKPKRVAIGLSIFNECPPWILMPDFYKKLFERTKYICKKLSDKNIEIVSPAIVPMKSSNANMFVEYFKTFSEYFDIYAVHCCNLGEQFVGQLVSILNKVFTYRPQTIWVRWGVSSAEYEIDHKSFYAGVKPYSYSIAVQRLRYSFSLIEGMVEENSHWFLLAGTDLYKTKKIPGPEEMWKSSSTLIDPYIGDHEWKYYHFLGLFEPDGSIKSPIYNMASQMIRDLNNV